MNVAARLTFLSFAIVRGWTFRAVETAANQILLGVDGRRTALLTGAAKGYAIARLGLSDNGGIADNCCNEFLRRLRHDRLRNGWKRTSLGVEGAFLWDGLEGRTGR